MPEHTPQEGHLPVTTESDEARAAFLVGRMMAFQYQQVRARRALDAAIAADPSFVLAYLHRGGMSNPHERGRYFETARAHRDGVSADEGLMVDAFHAFLWEQRVPDAVAIFTELADRYQEDPYLPTYLGLRYLHNLGEPDLAREQFEGALSRDPMFAPGHLWLGLVALRQEDLIDAEKHLTRYLDLAPDQPRAHDCLGLLRQKQGRNEEAEAAFARALALEPDFSDSRRRLVAMDIERAARTLQSAVEAGDPAAIANAHTVAARIVLPGGTVLEGSEAISKHWAESLARLGLETIDLTLGVDGDLITEVGRFRLGETEGSHITIWASTVSGWRIHRSLWAAD